VQISADAAPLNNWKIHLFDNQRIEMNDLLALLVPDIKSIEI
jgi:hypothetical protein